MSVEQLEKPLPRPRRDPIGYASARALEALLEALLALRFLGEGFTRNAAGKAYQAWRALTGALLVLEHEKLLRVIESDEQRRWLEEKAIPRIPSSRLKTLGQLLEKIGIPYYSSLTDKALDLHDYQYHGPDPDLELSKYRGPREAAYDILVLLRELERIIEERVKPRLREKNKWTQGHEEALEKLRESISMHEEGRRSHD